MSDNRIVLELVDENSWSSAKNNVVTLIRTDSVEIGILEITPSMRLPKEGYSIHEQNDEFAYILSGEVIFGTDKGFITLREGMFIYNRKGTLHHTMNNGSRPARIIWILSPPR